jgi:transposase
MNRRLSAALSEKKEALSHQATEIAGLTAIIRTLKRYQFGQKSEKLDPNQLALGLEDPQIGIDEADAELESRDATLKASRAVRRRAMRGGLPEHLPRVEVLDDTEDTAFPCCGGALNMISEDQSERLDVIPARLRTGTAPM